LNLFVKFAPLKKATNFYMSQSNNKPGFKFTFRAIMHMAIGVLYIILASYLFKVQKFGTVELGAAASYGLGALLLVYGGFRIWRGIQDARLPEA
jgi:threonine/homoserine/homoserine lactone efflux protein